MDIQLNPARVALRPATLFDACLVGLESDEFAPAPPGVMETRDGRVCAWGAMYAVARRAGVTDLRPRELHPRMTEIDHRAGKLLGYPGTADAFDGGVGFAAIAGALRQARDEIEAGAAAAGRA